MIRALLIVAALLLTGCARKTPERVDALAARCVERGLASDVYRFDLPGGDVHVRCCKAYGDRRVCWDAEDLP